mmetsp:Transcript_27062/g.58013  ORF Transcript_27062/g.58013 Transcript_27062/m.58013 type:complete len:685 (+) Transcript_27062:261-2315(+)
MMTSSHRHYKLYCFGGFLALLLLGLGLGIAEATVVGSKTKLPPTDADCSASESECKPNEESVDYLIIGAGGGGIQTALLLQNFGYTCKILEKEQTAASFWTKFPRFQELISVNKRVQNESHRYRYDWHSFLGTSIAMWKDVSKAYFPSGFDFYNYMNRVVNEAGINIDYGVEVESLAMDGRPCVRLVDGSDLCAKYRVFVGTGLKEKDERYLEAIGGVPYSKMNRTIAVQKRVCVLGNGNAGFEISQNVYDIADRVFVMGKHPARLSAVTKYTGDVRIKFLQTLENFHGKLLDSVYEPNRYLSGIGKELNATQLEELLNVIDAAITIDAHECEVLVLATGFHSFVPGMDLGRRKFPPMNDWYRAESNPQIHYVGWLMHHYDFRRGAGGFLSGYRYLIRNLINHVREIDHGIPYPYHNFTKEQILDHAANRFQISDELVILQDGVVVRDAIVTVKSKDGRNEYHYYEGVTFGFHKEFRQYDNVIYLYLAWGDGRSAASVFDNIGMYNNTEELRNTKLHPVVEVNGLVREGLEDIHMDFSIGMFVSPVKQMVRDALRGDYSKFYQKPSYTYERMGYSKSKDGKTPEIGDDMEGTLYLTNLRKAVTQAILLGGTEESLQQVRFEARSTFPTLTFIDSHVVDSQNETKQCAQPGRSCGSSSIPCCEGEGTRCIYNAGIKASFCVIVDP